MTCCNALGPPVDVPIITIFLSPVLITGFAFTSLISSSIKPSLVIFTSAAAFTFFINSSLILARLRLILPEGFGRKSTAPYWNAVIVLSEEFSALKIITGVGHSLIM
ncbi:Uncharacterised protein [uncultured archaeon]|nr:Uncharacterised protein [uncultured archaeon]